MNGGDQILSLGTDVTASEQYDVFGILSPIFFVLAKRDCIIQGYMCFLCIWQPIEIILEKTDVTHYC